MPLLMYCRICCSSNPPAPTEIFTLSLHDALPIYGGLGADLHHALALAVPVGHRHALPWRGLIGQHRGQGRQALALGAGPDRKSTRLNSSHLVISYAVFCLKKKKT